MSIQFSPTSRDEDERRQIGENRGKKGNHDAISYYPWDWYVYLPTNLPLKTQPFMESVKYHRGNPGEKRKPDDEIHFKNHWTGPPFGEL